MGKIYNGILDLVGNTPLVEAANLGKKWNLKAKLLLKLEYFNPAGSVKDRVAKEMLEDAERRGVISAAASIIAKVTRDRLMVQYDEVLPGYGFAQHKGYGSKEHIEALQKLGPAPIHRRSFIGHFV